MGLRTFALVLLALSCTAQTPEASPDPRAELLALARATINEARYCALVTVDGEGQPRARTVDPFAPDENFVIWIATRPVTRKVEQIKHNPDITLYYFDAINRNYVTVMGKARLVDDVEVKNRMRREADWARLYPDFPNDYLLIEVTPRWLEAMVPGHRGDAETWRPSAVYFDE